MKIYKLILLLAVGLIFYLDVNSQNNEKVFVPFRVGENYGIADIDANLIIQPEYSVVPIYNKENNLFIVKKGNEYGLKNLNDQFVFKTDFKINRIYPNFYLLSKDKKYKLVNPNGLNLLDKEYSRIIILNNNFAVLVDSNNHTKLIKITPDSKIKFSIIDSTTKNVFPPHPSDSIFYFSKKYEVIKYKVSKNDIQIIEVIKREINDFDESVELIRKTDNKKAFGRDSIYLAYSIFRSRNYKDRGNIVRTKYINYLKTNYQKAKTVLIEKIPILNNYKKYHNIRHIYPQILKDSLFNYKGTNIPISIKNEFVTIEDSSSHYHIINYKGEVINSFPIDKLSEKPLLVNCNEFNFIFKYKNNWGILGSTGEEKLSPAYDTIIFLDKYVKRGKNFGSICFFNTLGIHTVVNNKHGISDFGNKELVPHEMDSIFRINSAFLLQKDGKYGVFRKEVDINTEGYSYYKFKHKASRLYIYPMFKEKIIGLTEINGVTFLRLGNEDGLFLGYANQNGKKYFRD